MKETTIKYGKRFDEEFQRTAGVIEPIMKLSAYCSHLRVSMNTIIITYA